MQHFCPTCQRSYDCKCNEAMMEIFGPHGLSCGTPFEWRCPECAKKDKLLYGGTNPMFPEYVYTKKAA